MKQNKLTLNDFKNGTFLWLKIVFSMNMEGKQRRYELEQVLESLKGSSETTRETRNDVMI